MLLFFKSPLRKYRFLSKSLTVLFALVFLCVSLSCSHAPAKSSSKDQPVFKESQAQTYKSGELPWWKNPETEWLVATLIVIGIGISIGAAIMISSGGGGLNVRINK